MGRKVRPAKARLFVGSIFDDTVDYHRALDVWRSPSFTRSLTTMAVQGMLSFQSERIF
ncbi:hypothetical protein [Synechocystis sp. PCC 6714]|uniref:hypothetical protein n=1 Tax=Synechocystis sp. (strain PCC 6714) TaxID=1147 RepID=UPI00041A553A|nr:hypothetical protein [Synechocystis sp. PCC 6714]AIE76187.1 hypothetical protein D082_50250 [Synechocystis sp. PCC 6714]